MRSILVAGFRCHMVAPALALACLGAGSASALGVVGKHTTLASFQAATRGNPLLEPFNGPDGQNLPSVPVSGGGFAGTVSAGAFGLIRSATFGVGCGSSGETMQLTFTGRPVSAFAGTLFVIDGGFAAVAGTVTLHTNTGETITAEVAAGGAFFGFTTSQPFTSLTIEAPPNVTTEFIDNAYLGIAASAAELTDNCADAVTISPTTAAQYPFSTLNTGATYTQIFGSCASAPSLDNGPDVWVRFVSTVYGNVTVNTCGATFDTVLRVFADCGLLGSGVGATQITCSDDFCTGGGGNLASQVQFRVEAGEDYLIRVSGYNSQTGTGNLTFSVVPDCAADFNHTGGSQTVQDLFDFLTAWFDGC